VKREERVQPLDPARGWEVLAHIYPGFHPGLLWV